MKLIDTHCHLAHGRLRQDTPDVLARAAEAGVISCICAAGTVAETKAALSLAGQYDTVWFTAGVHPHDATSVNDDALRQIGQLAGRDRCAAVGEIGLDYHYDFSPREAQRQAFAAQLALARDIAKPIVIHTREALEDTLAILAEADVGDLPVVFHSFTGGADGARRVLDIGATIGFSGIATFNRADDIRQAVALTPADRIMVETDAPYLSPEPVRKMKTNEPANVAHVAMRLAQVRNISPDAFAEQTTANARRLFGLDLSV